MGIFGKLFGTEKELPQLDPSSPAAAKLNSHKVALETFVSKIHDTMEFVPADNTIYAFIGKPPSMFGLAWFEDGKEVNFKNFTAGKGLKPKQVQSIYGKLGEAYAECAAEPRFGIQIAGKKVVVLPSDSLAKKIVELVHTIE
ncbi:MAG: hypothetical protein HZB33_01080 [Nitrospirae bacterium]|nr:hypothetical protein [Nitrospirota bacterium]